MDSDQLGDCGKQYEIPLASLPPCKSSQTHQSEDYSEIPMSRHRRVPL